MSFTYAVGTVASNTTHQVRFLLQDITNTTARPALLADEEIAWVVTTEMNVYMAAALCADALASRFRGTQSKKVGNLELRYDSGYWDKVAKSLRMRGSTHQVISAGGLSADARDGYFEDDDLIQPEIHKGLHYDPTTQGPSRSTDLTDEESS